MARKAGRAFCVRTRFDHPDGTTTEEIDRHAYRRKPHAVDRMRVLAVTLQENDYTQTTVGADERVLMMGKTQATLTLLQFQLWDD